VFLLIAMGVFSSFRRHNSFKDKFTWKFQESLSLDCKRPKRSHIRNIPFQYSIKKPLSAFHIVNMAPNVKILSCHFMPNFAFSIIVQSHVKLIKISETITEIPQANHILSSYSVISNKIIARIKCKLLITTVKRNGHCSLHRHLLKPTWHIINV
jgi:hypothetical protein